MDGSGRNYFGRFLGGKASPSSFAVAIASHKTLVYLSSFFLSYSRLLTGKTSSEYLYTDTYARRKYAACRATAWPAPARPAAAGPAPVPSAGGSQQTGPAPSFIYALLSKNAVNRGFLRFSNSMKCCQVLATKRL